MRYSRSCAIWLMAGCMIAHSVAQVRDGGGRDVRVALFTTRTVRGVTVVPVGTGAWIASCAGCAHLPLVDARSLSGTGEMFAGGTLRVTDAAGGDARMAAGLWHMRAGREGVDVEVTIPSERYVEAVLSAEAGADEPAASLQALAIVARTYVLNGRHWSPRPGHLEADVCDSTECQAMRLGAVTDAIRDAVRATAGETLWFGGRRAETYFSQSCGGVTEDAGALWPRLAGTLYLRSHADPYCLKRDKAEWHAEVSLDDLEQIARAEGWRIPGRIAGAEVVSRSGSHRALKVRFSGADGGAAELSASALRFGVGRRLAWDLIRSDAYDVTVREGRMVFDGRGHGHGVGLCQQGATEMAREGKSAREILAFYFPGTVVRITPGDEGWREMQAGALRVQSAEGLSAERGALLERTWSEAQRRFAARRDLRPQVVFAPTTEVFRQMTGEPGWALGSAQGDTIVMEPEQVFHANGVDEGKTLLHEMLHVLVESAAGERSPLWLREGLVEVLAGDVRRGATPMSDAEMAAALAHAKTLAESRRAHDAAAAKVDGLVQRYGLATVRGWLGSGVPAGTV